MGYSVEHRVDTSDRGNLDGSWGQTYVAVGIIGTVEGEHVVIDALQGEVLQGELHGGVSLQGHTLLDAVQIHACYHGLLCIIGCLLVDDAGKCAHFVGCQSDG